MGGSLASPNPRLVSKWASCEDMDQFSVVINSIMQNLPFLFCSIVIISSQDQIHHHLLIEF